jgi:hypothetical protein
MGRGRLAQMNASQFAMILALGASTLMAQSPAPSASTYPAAPAATPATSTPIANSAQVVQTFSSQIGFSYSLPLDWEIVDSKPMLPVVKQQSAETASSKAEKKGLDCVQIAFLTRNGTPYSVIEAVVLPFDCFGESFTDKDLAGVASGMAKGMGKSFDMKDPIYGAYKLGKHHFWIERANGIYLEHPEMKRTVEVTCTVLKKGLACWIAMAADQEALNTFERAPTTLEDDKNSPALVPGDVFTKKP